MSQEKMDWTKHIVPNRTGGRKPVEYLLYTPTFEDMQKDMEAGYGVAEITDFAAFVGRDNGLYIEGGDYDNGYRASNGVFYSVRDVPNDAANEYWSLQNSPCARVGFKLKLRGEGGSLETHEVRTDKATYHTIQIGEYPSSKVKEDSYLLNELEATANGRRDTGGWTGKWITSTSWDFEAGNRDERPESVTFNSLHSSEMEMDGKRYVKVSKSLGEWRWFEVEPVSYIIRNWNRLPTDINPEGDGTAEYLDLISEKVIVSNIYPGSYSWAGSFMRDFLNGTYDSKRSYGLQQINAFDNTNDSFLNQSLNLAREPVSSYVVSKDTSIVPYLSFNGVTSLKEVKIPKGVISIEPGAFSGCENLSTVILSSGVRIIKRRAFADCNSLKNIELTKSLRKIEEDAFKNCKSLESVNIPSQVWNIGRGAFAGCTALREVSLPSNLKEIQHDLFLKCENLKKVTIPKKLATIRQGAFAGCKSLKEIVLPKSIKYVSGDAFQGCDNLERVVYPGTAHLYEVIRGLRGGNLNYYYELNGKKVFDKSAPAKNATNVIDLSAYNKAFSNFGFGEILINTPQRNVDLALVAKSLNTSKLRMDEDFENLLYRMPEEELHKFALNGDFRFFKGEAANTEWGRYVMGDQKDYMIREELQDFYKFAMNLGCFSSEKIKDKNGKDTQKTVGQVASVALSKIVQQGIVPLGKFHGLFDSLPVKAPENTNFLQFINAQGTKKQFENVQTLMELENSGYPGIFAKAMYDFEKIKTYRNGLDEDGRPIKRSWEEALKIFYSQVKYSGVRDDNEDIAHIFGGFGVDQRYFDQATRMRREAREKQVPKHILSKHLKESSIMSSIEELKDKTNAELEDSKALIDDLYSKQFTYEMLDKSDARNFVMGIYCSCCATISSAAYGRDIANSTVVAEDVQNLVIRNDKGRIVSKGTMYINKEHGYAVINDFEMSGKYRDHESRDPGIYDVEKDHPSEVQRDLIFKAFMRGIDKFVENYDAENPECPLKQVNVGMGYNRLKRQVQEFKKATKNLQVPEEYGFYDAKEEQYILYERSKKADQRAKTSGEDETQKSSEAQIGEAALEDRVRAGEFVGGTPNSQGLYSITINTEDGETLTEQGGNQK